MKTLRFWVVKLCAAGVVLATCGCVLMYNSFDFTTEIKPLEETTVSGEGRNRILMVDLSGEIFDQEKSGLFGITLEESIVALVKDQLDKAKEDKKIKAILIRINSPGGSVTASDLLYQQFKTFRQETGIPIYAVMMDVAASGGYYIAMAANKVYAHPTTVTGSIGVIMFNLSLEGLMKKVGVASKIVKSGENKDMGSPLKDFTPEEKKLLQGIIDDLYLRFVEVIVAGRPGLTREAILKAADGRVYTANQAKEIGLIDGIFYLPDAIAKIQQDLHLSKAKVVVYSRPNRYVSNIYSHLQQPVPKGLNLIDPGLLKPLARNQNAPGFYYLWEP